MRRPRHVSGEMCWGPQNSINNLCYHGTQSAMLGRRSPMNLTVLRYMQCLLFEDPCSHTSPDEGVACKQQRERVPNSGFSHTSNWNGERQVAIGATAASSGGCNSIRNQAQLQNSSTVNNGPTKKVEDNPIFVHLARAVENQHEELSGTQWQRHAGHGLKRSSWRLVRGHPSRDNNPCSLLFPRPIKNNVRHKCLGGRNEGRPKYDYNTAVHGRTTRSKAFSIAPK